MKKTVLALVLMATGAAVLGSAPLRAAAEPAAAAVPSAEIECGAIAGPKTMLPGVIHAPEGVSLRLWLANASGRAGSFIIQTPAGAALAANKNAIVDLALAPLPAGAYEIRFQPKGAAAVTGTLRVGGEPAAKQEIVILQGWKMFRPVTTRVSAGKPTVLHLFSNAAAPHRNFELLKAGVKLPFKTNKVETLAIQDGLPAGEYRISRPGHPNQNHGITSKVVAE